MQDTKSKAPKPKTFRIEWLLLIAVVFVIIGPWVITREAIWPILDLSGKGEIGDVIGGVTAPVINLVAAYLVYIAFKEQKRANDEQVKAIIEERKERREDIQVRDEEIIFNTVLTEIDFCIDQYDSLEIEDRKGIAALQHAVYMFSRPVKSNNQDVEVLRLLVSLKYLKEYLYDLAMDINTLNNIQRRIRLKRKLLILLKVKTQSVYDELTKIAGTNGEIIHLDTEFNIKDFSIKPIEDIL